MPDHRPADDDADTSPPELAPGFLLMALGRAMHARVETELRPLGIAMRHYSALGHLAATPGISYSELARRAGITVQSMQATLTQLEGLDAVERRSHPGRGRTADLHVTEQGHNLIRQARAAFWRAEDELLGGVDADERAHLASALARLLPTRQPLST